LSKKAITIHYSPIEARVGNSNNKKLLDYEKHKITELQTRLSGNSIKLNGNNSRTQSRARENLHVDELEY
jgi:hypothetical protein